MDLLPLREILYTILTGVTEEQTDIKANQQMGVQLSSAVKKDGVNIIQLQNVISQKVISSVTEALRFLDVQASVPALPMPETLESFMTECLRGESDLKLFMKKMEQLYIRCAVNQLGAIGAKRILKIRQIRVEEALNE